MLKIKRNKKLMIPVIAIMLLVVMAGSALAGYSSVKVDSGYGTLYGRYSNFSQGDVDRVTWSSVKSTSTYITAYLYYDGANRDGLRVYNNGVPTTRESYLDDDERAKACLEAIWGGNHIAYHTASN